MNDENRSTPVPPLPAAPQQQAAPSQQAFPQPPVPTPPQLQPWQQQQGGQQPWQQAAQQGWQQQGAQQGWQQQGAQQGTQQGAQQGQAPSWEQLKASGAYAIPPEYNKPGFNPEGFNVAAFLFSCIWYFVKGMWQKGLALFAVAVVLAFIPFGKILGLGIAIYAGMFGTRDYLRYHNSKQQFWF